MTLQAKAVARRVQSSASLRPDSVVSTLDSLPLRSRYGTNVSTVRSMCSVGLYRQELTVSLYRSRIALLVRANSRTRKIVTDVAIFAVSQVLFYAAFKAVMSSMDPQSNKRNEAKAKSKKALGKLGLDLSSLDLNEHEEIMAAEVVHADDITTRFKGEPATQLSRAGGDPADVSPLQTSVDLTQSSRSSVKLSSSLCAIPKSSSRLRDSSAPPKESSSMDLRVAARRCSPR